MGNDTSRANKCPFNSKRSASSKKVNFKKQMVQTEPIRIPRCSVAKKEFPTCSNSVPKESSCLEESSWSPVKYRFASQKLLNRFVRFSPKFGEGSSSKFDEGRRNKEDEVDFNCSLPPCLAISESSLPVVFRWNQGGNKVFISGSFNEWMSVEMAKSDGNFMTILNMPEGQYRYRFLVDGIWKYDEEQPCIEKENCNYNIIIVKKDDFEIFDALAMHNQYIGSPSNYSPSPPRENYSQEFPKREKLTIGPPVLPPHLFQIILNAEKERTEQHRESSILPQPSHFMLNHLYTSSIEDNVIVLSVIQRFRTRYVTTIFYTPLND